MADFIEEARQNYDIIIIDLPPVCEVADAGVVSGLVDHYVMVVRSNHSDIRLVSAAVDMLQGLGGSVSGFVINEVNPKVRAYYAKSKYSKAYRYGYRYGISKSNIDSSNS